MPETFSGGRMAPPILLKPSADAAAADAIAAEIMAATGAWDRGAPPTAVRSIAPAPLRSARTANDPDALAAEVIATMDRVEPCGR